MIYLGKFDWYYLAYTSNYSGKRTTVEKKYIFIKKDGSYETMNNLNSLAIRNGDTPVSNYAELMDNFNNSQHSCRPVRLESEPINEINLTHDPNSYFNVGPFFRKINDNNFVKCYVQADYKSEYITAMAGQPYSHSHYKRVFKGFSAHPQEKIQIENNSLIRTSTYSTNEKLYTADEIKSMEFVNLFVVLENNKRIELEKY